LPYFYSHIFPVPRFPVPRFLLPRYQRPLNTQHCIYMSLQKLGNSCSPSALNMPSGCRGLAESQSSPFESDKKTQVMWLGCQHLLSRLDIVHIPILPSCIRVQETARDLGFVIDSRLSLGEHVASVSRSGYYQLRQLQPAVRCLSEHATETLVQAFIASRLVYCNALFFGITNELFCRMQSVQNAAARFVMGARSDHSTAMFRRLHCFPVRKRVVFKIATLVYRSLSGLALEYLADDCQLLSPTLEQDYCVLLKRGHWLSTEYPALSGTGPLQLPAASTRVWNSLPSGLRKAELSYCRFRRSLETNFAV